MTNEQKIYNYDRPLGIVYEDTSIKFSDIVFYGIVANLCLACTSMIGIITIAIRLAL